MPPQSRYLRCREREVHFVEWGRTDAPALVLWHGLLRTGRDFDDLAGALADTYRIICPDTPGRGLSQWSPEPRTEYTLSFYIDVAAALADVLGIQRMRWVGTSMGGGIGIAAATTALRGRITHLVLNDMAPTVARAAVERIAAYASAPPELETMTAFEEYLRTIYRSYGWLSDAQWRRMAETSARRLPSGAVTTHYDPAVGSAFASGRASDFEQWAAYDALRIPTLVLRGAGSDLLPPEIAHQMTQRGPRAQLVEIAGCGHAPALNVAGQFEVVAAFLAQDSA
ncbi:MAG: alpha/beta fold hydrolase [Candidatus Velthaea sp.]